MAGTSGAKVACWPAGSPRRGSSVITIDALAPTLSDRYFSWDDHINVQTRWDLNDAMRYRAPFVDQAPLGPDRRRLPSAVWTARS